ncbi:MAG: hypothetical protein AAB785_03170 [Patescibacteria group bacterium]
MPNKMKLEIFSRCQRKLAKTRLSRIKPEAKMKGIGLKRIFNLKIYHKRALIARDETIIIITFIFCQKEFKKNSFKFVKIILIIFFIEINSFLASGGI